MVQELKPRQTNTGDLPGQGGSNNSTVSTGQSVAIAAIVTLAIVVTGVIALYIYLRRLRLQGRSARFLPTQFLKQRWNKWHPVGKYASVNLAERGDAAAHSRANSEARQPTSTTGTTRAGAGTTNSTTSEAGVNRNTSVRSVMTLPAYSQSPKETEQVIGREGERAGMDTVVEFPETQEEEEVARETEMESLYQIRQARRREIAEREERRRERREARDRGDWARLEELRQQSRHRNQPSQNESTGNLTADTLIAEHQSRPKDRRVSSVAYADVGHVRHDGTRLRANSHESERGGLLEGAAPMGEGVHGRSASDAGSLLSLDNLSRPNLPFTGNRQRSDSGALSISTASSFDLPQPTPGSLDESNHRNSDGSEHQRSASTSDDSPGAPRLTPPGTDGASDSNDHVEHDFSRPPDYEYHDWGDAPAYEAEVRRRESQRSGQLAVPRISIQMPSEPNSPNLSRISEDATTRR